MRGAVLGKKTIPASVRPLIIRELGNNKNKNKKELGNVLAGHFDCTQGVVRNMAVIISNSKELLLILRP
jgi:hypothetical protein